MVALIYTDTTDACTGSTVYQYMHDASIAEILEKVNEVEFITDVSSFSELASIARYKSMKIVAGANVHASKLLPGSFNEHVSSS